jgi:hypothetical protein
LAILDNQALEVEAVGKHLHVCCAPQTAEYLNIVSGAGYDPETKKR